MAQQRVGVLLARGRGREVRPEGDAHEGHRPGHGRVVREARAAGGEGVVPAGDQAADLDAAIVDAVEGADAGVGDQAVEVVGCFGCRGRGGEGDVEVAAEVGVAEGFGGVGGACV